jgi:hypothetical protein
MSRASSEWTTTANSSSFASGLVSKKSYDVRVLTSVAIVAVGVVVAIIAVAASEGISADEVGLMTAFP